MEIQLRSPFSSYRICFRDRSRRKRKPFVLRFNHRAGTRAISAASAGVKRREHSSGTLCTEALCVRSAAATICRAAAFAMVDDRAAIRAGRRRCPQRGAVGRSRSGSRPFKPFSHAGSVTRTIGIAAHSLVQASLERGVPRVPMCPCSEMHPAARCFRAARVSKSLLHLWSHWRESFARPSTAAEVRARYVKPRCLRDGFPGKARCRDGGALAPSGESRFVVTLDVTLFSTGNRYVKTHVFQYALA